MPTILLILKYLTNPKNYLELGKTFLGLRIIREELREIKKILQTNPALSPVDNFITANYLCNESGHFHKHYYEWRMKRIRTILEIYGIEWEGRRVLELGGGLGDIGAFFAQLGAEVLSLEGRQSNVNFANLKYRTFKNFKSVCYDLEKDFTNYGSFDVILNLGLIEAIQNINPLLECSVKMSDNIVVETMVCDSADPNKIVYVTRDVKGIDSGIRPRHSRPSPFYIERFFKEHGYEAERYFTQDLNTKTHFYDWEHTNDGSVKEGMKRFWNFRRKK